MRVFHLGFVQFVILKWNNITVNILWRKSATCACKKLNINIIHARFIPTYRKVTPR